jgi:antitoxin component YwqK of YwqJK toxin-antitoxin module
MKRQTEIAVSILKGCVAILLILPYTACGPTIEVIHEGKMEYQGYWDEDGQFIRHGYYKAYYDSEKIQTTGQYEQNYRRGVWIQWHPNGQKQNEMDWVDGKPEGIVTEWYASGQIRNRGTWENGGRHGLSTWWYENGIKEKEVTYIDGEPDGEWTYSDSTGVLDKKQYWRRGEFLRVEEHKTTQN